LKEKLLWKILYTW